MGRGWIDPRHGGMLRSSSCECVSNTRGSSAIRRCISVFGQRVGPATGLAIRMSGRATDADWEGAGQRRAPAFVPGQGEIMRVASRTRRWFLRTNTGFRGRPALEPRPSALPTTRNPSRKQPAPQTWPMGWTIRFCFRSWSNWAFRRLL